LKDIIFLNKNQTYKIVIILIIILISWITLFFFIRGVNKKYFSLINTQTKLMQISHHATKESNAIYINILKISKLNDSVIINKIKNDLDSISRINDKYFAELKETDHSTIEELDKVINARNKYKIYKDKFIASFINNNYDNKSINIDSLLEQSFKIYQENLEAYVKTNSLESKDLSIDINRKAKITTTFLIIIAILPVIIILLLIILILLFYFSYWDDYVKRTME